MDIRNDIVYIVELLETIEGASQLLGVFTSLEEAKYYCNSIEMNYEPMYEYLIATEFKLDTPNWKGASTHMNKLR